MAALTRDQGSQKHGEVGRRHDSRQSLLSPHKLGWDGLGWAGLGWAGGEGAVFNVTQARVGGGEELLPQVWQCETIIILVSGSGLV